MSPCKIYSITPTLAAPDYLGQIEDIQKKKIQDRLNLKLEHQDHCGIDCEDVMKEKAEDIVGRKERALGKYCADEESRCPFADIVTPCSQVRRACGMGRELNSREGAVRCLSARQSDWDIEDPDGATSRWICFSAQIPSISHPSTSARHSMQAKIIVFDMTSVYSPPTQVNLDLGCNGPERDSETHCAAYQESDSGLRLSTEKVSCMCVGIDRHWGSMTWLWQ
ncbi:hypothetical protein B0H11DRAFT_1938224 [Mycena galericulata]|nr:hypothetical protein B0H11DRAFT_1938224 [Mycena galericulata]